MNAQQFIKDHGLDAVRDAIYEADVYGGLWINTKTLELSHFIPSGDSVSVTELQRLVESVDLIKSCGGIENVKDENPIGDFPSEIEQRLPQAIKDYESIYGEGNE